MGTYLAAEMLYLAGKFEPWKSLKIKSNGARAIKILCSLKEPHQSRPITESRALESS